MTLNKFFIKNLIQLSFLVIMLISMLIFIFMIHFIFPVIFMFTKFLVKVKKFLSFFIFFGSQDLCSMVGGAFLPPPPPTIFKVKYLYLAYYTFLKTPHPCHSQYCDITHFLQRKIFFFAKHEKFRI